ncbi:MAG: sugar ABC transporter ATP-binding protein [Oscillospiraceae bacterium]|nr:sugar ABC transporter ATP-binding protein [Oscillospiraceae bacterium]
MAGYIEFDNIRKDFPGVVALSNVCFRVNGGTVCALLGENGAGKSTLLKVLSGDILPDEGEIRIDGKTCVFNSPRESIKASVSVIYQERQLVPGMSVMENIFIDDLPVKGIRLDKPALRKRTQEMLDEFGLTISPNELVGRLSVAHQQMIEIMKAYKRDSKIIAFDEPTAPLTEIEIAILFRLILQLKEKGKIIIYVSHRMAEIFQVTDEIVVLKDGQLVNTFVTAGTSEQELIAAMVGRDIGDTYANLRRGDTFGDVLLEVRNLVTDSIKNVSFKLRRGEVLGFAGLVGAGRTEVARAIFGDDRIISGELILDGVPVRFKSPGDAIKAGIALCPEDRKEQGLVLGRSISNNVSSAVLPKMKTGLFLDKKKEKALAESAVEKYDIKTPTVDKTVFELSGGNQQKVILGRWTSDIMDTKILILDEPTKGIDVGTKAEIYQTVCDFASAGMAVIFISSELTEVINLADTVIVMHNGRITGTLARQEATEENVLKLAMSEEEWL